MTGSAFVRGVGVTPFGRHLDRPLYSLAEEAVELALKDAHADVESIDAVFFANSVAGLTTGQEMARGQFALRGTGLLGRLIVNVENACASGSTAFYLAVQGVRAGLWRSVLVVGAEKMFHEQRAVTSAALASASDIERTPPSSSSTPMMDLYAEHTLAYMKISGATVEDFAAVVVKNRSNASHNPLAQYRSPTTAADVLSAPVVADPLTRLMCSPLADGAAALVVVGEGSRQPASPVVKVLASRLTAGGGTGDTIAQTAVAAYEEAAVEPAEISVAEVHDAAAPAELEMYEKLAFCGAGEAPALLRSGATQLGGRQPVNPGGGLIARGHPLAATGVAQLAEITLQLRGQAGARQVEGASVGLVQNAGGDLGEGGPAASAVHILGR